MHKPRPTQAITNTKPQELAFYSSVEAVPRLWSQLKIISETYLLGSAARLLRGGAVDVL